MRVFPLAFGFSWLCGLLLASVACGQSANVTIQLSLKGRTIEGQPLKFTANEIHLLARDGALWSFAPHEATDFQKTADGFTCYSHAEFRGALLREFGKGFDVSGTGSYLVVHPVGQRDKWAPRFDELYRSFLHYFSARGFYPTVPKFPLVAVVFPTQAEFMRFAVKDGVPVTGGLLGYYSPASNRILLFDVTAGDEAQQDWHLNAETIIHEAAHQTAFNTGIHSRYAMPPRWVAEGLGTLFEARGVWNSRENTKQADRINKDRLAAFRRYTKTRPAGHLPQFVATDRAFQTNPDFAYAEAWALTFFLSETEPRKYVQYLAKTAGHPDFTVVPATTRLKDFTDVFGTSLELLESRFLRFIADIK